MVYHGRMATPKQIRRSLTLPARVEREVEAIAKKSRLSGNRVLLDLVETGLQARRKKEKAFFELAEQFRNAEDPETIKRLGNELGRLVFGE